MGIVTLIGLIILEVVLLFFTFLILRSKPTSKQLKKSFVWFMLSLGLWSACNYFSNSSALGHDDLLIVNRLLFVSSITIALAAVFFIDIVLEADSAISKRLSVASSILAVGLSATPFVVSNIHRNAGSVAIDFGVMAWLYFALLVVISGSALIILMKGMRSTIRHTRAVARVLLISLGGVTMALFITNVIAPVFFHNFAITAIGPFLIVGIIVGVTYAIVRHGLFDIRLALARSVTYALVLGVVISLYFGLVYVVSIVVHSPLAGPDVTLLYASIAVATAILFQPLKLLFDRVTNKLFYKENYNSDDFFMSVSHALGLTTDLRRLLASVSEEISKTLSPSQAFFVVNKENGRRTTVGLNGRESLSATAYEKIDEYILRYNHQIVLTELMPAKESVRTMLTKSGIALVMPLSKSSSGHMGYLLLGDRLSGDYTSRDVRILSTISGEIAIAIQNALSVQEVKDLNATLQQRIDDATKELRSSNEKLQRLDEAKDEFVSMASHQLRTPLTSVKGYIDMVLDGDAGKITDMQRKLLSEAFTSSERMVHLINDFLNVSRLQTGKFMVDRRKVDLAKVVLQEVESLQTTADSRNLTLKYRKPSTFPILYIDEGKLRQVIMNFIDNAFFYSREHSTVTVSLRTEAGEAVMTVKDSGMGVPQSEQKHLFTKFFRATNARKQRPDGTGVGLFLAKKVIVAHGGTVIFESVEGKGSTFGFRLPIKKLSLAPADDAN